MIGLNRRMKRENLPPRENSQAKVNKRIQSEDEEYERGPLKMRIVIASQ